MPAVMSPKILSLQASLIVVKFRFLTRSALLNPFQFMLTPSAQAKFQTKKLFNLFAKTLICVLTALSKCLIYSNPFIVRQQAMVILAAKTSMSAGKKQIKLIRFAKGRIFNGEYLNACTN